MSMQPHDWYTTVDGWIVVLGALGIVALLLLISGCSTPRPQPPGEDLWIIAKNLPR